MKKVPQPPAAHRAHVTKDKHKRKEEEILKNVREKREKLSCWPEAPDKHANESSTTTPAAMAARGNRSQISGELRHMSEQS